MRQAMLTLVLMITVGGLAYEAGRNAQTTAGPQVLNSVQTEEPHVVLAKSGMRQQKETRQKSEGCQVVPNEDLSRQRTDEQDITTKGLVF